MANHKSLDYTEGHTLASFVFKNQSVRDHAIGFTSDDLHKVGLQEDNQSFWVLTGINPAVWSPFGDPKAQLQTVKQNVDQTDVVNITHPSDPNGKRTLQISKFIPGQTGLSNTSLDFDLIDASQFVQEDAVNGTDINGQLTLHDVGGGGGFVVGATTVIDNPNAYGTTSSDWFGRAVAVSDSYTVVGAQQEDDAGGTDSGKAYIFDNATGNLLYTLDNPNAYDTSANDNFGESVAICELYSIVGASHEDDASGGGSGKAYIFDNTTGNLLHTLDNPNPYGTGTNDYFGESLSICTQYSLVCAHYEDSLGHNATGRAYLFDNATGTLLFTFENPNAYGSSDADNFGVDVAVSGSYSIVGASTEDEAVDFYSGKAYIFDNATGNLLYTLDNPNAYGTSSYDNFGNAVAICESYSIVGSIYEDDAGGSNAGKAYIFDNATGNLLHTLDNPNAYGTSADDRFGTSVSITESYSSVGAPQEDDASGANSGKVYIFDNATGNLLHTLDNPNAYGTTASDEFGLSVAISESYAVAGVMYEDDAGGTDSGKAYLFDIGISKSYTTSPATPAALVIHADGDASSNNHEITHNGNVTYIPKSPIDRLAIQNPNGSYFNVDTALGGIGAGDFTIEGWFNPTFIQAQNAIISNSPTGTIANSWRLEITATGVVNMMLNRSGDIHVTSVGKVPTNKWTHIAVVRESGLVSIYFNGKADASTVTANDSLNDVGGGVTIFRVHPNYTSYPVFTGLVAELRVSTVARYSTNFTPSTDAFVSDADTKFLLQAGAEGSTSYVDASSNNYTVTMTGSTKTVVPAKFGNSCISFDGSASTRMEIPHDASFDFGTGDFTVELWGKTTDTGGFTFISKVQGGGYSDICFQMTDFGSGLDVYIGGPDITMNAGTVNDGIWHHIALVRNGSDFTLYKDGVSVGTSTSAAAVNNLVIPIQLGVYNYAAQPLLGEMCEVRISDTARYTADFSTSLQTTPHVDDANTLLLIHGEGTAVGLVDLTTYGDPQLVAGKFEEAFYFDGTGDYIYASGVTSPGASDFTIDMWVQDNLVDTKGCLFIGRTADTGIYGVLLYAQHSLSNWKLRLGIDGVSDSLLINATQGIPRDAQFHHVAIVRSGDVITLYLDGVPIGSGAFTGSLNEFTGGVTLGRLGGSASSYFNGLIDEFRISESALWTADFSAELPSVYTASGGTGYYITTSDTNQLDLTDIDTINSVSFTSAEPANTSLGVLISFDGRTTWKTAALTNHVGSVVKTGWSTITEIEAALSSYNVTSESTLDFAFLMSTSDSAVTPSIDLITVNYDENGVYNIAPDSDFTIVHLDPTTTQITKESVNPENIKVNVII